MATEHCYRKRRRSPGKTVRPEPRRGRLFWEKDGRVFRPDQERLGLVLKTEIGVLGPLSVLQPDTSVYNNAVTFSVDGVKCKFEAKPSFSKAGVGFLTAEVPGTAWPINKLRSPAEPETCVLLFGKYYDEVVLAPESLRVQQGYWEIALDLNLKPNIHHGAPVMAAADGKVIGVLLIESGTSRIQPLPEDWLRE